MRASIWIGLSVSGLTVACGLGLSGSSVVDIPSDDSGADDGTTGGKDGGALTTDGTATPVDSGNKTTDGGTPIDATIDATTDGTAPIVPEISLISPYDPTGSLTYAFAINWTIACDPPAQIYATLDGTTPTTASAHGLSPITINQPASGTVIKWIAGNDPTVHSFTVKIDSTVEGSNQGFLDGFTFQIANSPIIHAAPGATITMNVASEWEWNQENESDDIDQLTVGMDAGVGCLEDTVPGAYPGQRDQNVALAITAPSAPGMYPVRIGFMEQDSCFSNMGALAGSLGSTQVGLVIVP